MKGFQELDRFELLNVEVDFNAKKYWTEKYEDKDKLPPYIKYTTPKGM